MPIKIILSIFLTSFSIVLCAEELERPITPSCQPFIDSEQHISTVITADTPYNTIEASWNKHYRNGHSAIRLGNYSLAQQEMCLALIQAESFDERDWRFAETLDELGLIHFMLGEDSESEKTQGAAVAELLLAVGPNSQKQPKTRNISLFMQRLGLVYKRQRRDELTEKLMQKPYKIYELGYIPLDQDLARRLAWLVSEYLGLENMDAANELLELISEIDFQKTN